VGPGTAPHAATPSPRTRFGWCCAPLRYPSRLISSPHAIPHRCRTARGDGGDRCGTRGGQGCPPSPTLQPIQGLVRMKTAFALALALALAGFVPLVVAQDEEAAGQAPEVSLEQVQDTGMLVSLAQQAERSEDWQAAARIWKRLTVLRPQRGD